MKKLTPLEKARKDFNTWWKPQTEGSYDTPMNKRGRFCGCSENWGAWQAWQKAKLGKVLED